jgi:hypothetical protein
MEQQTDSNEEALRRVIGTLSQSDPLIKLVEQVRLGRMKATDPGLRAIIDSWLATYERLLGSERFTTASLIRLDPSPRLAILLETGMLQADHAALLSLKSRYEAVLAAAMG